VPIGGAANSGHPASHTTIPQAPADAHGRWLHPRHTRQLFLHYWLPVLFMLGVIKTESTATWSGVQTGRLLSRLLARLGLSLSGEELELLNLILRKCGHVIGYGLLCYTWFLLLRGAYWFQHEYQLAIKGSILIRRLWWRIEWAAVAVFCTFLVALFDETHQMTIPLRTGRMHDVALDTAAAILVVTLLWLRTRRRRCTEPQRARA
jgi:VanZ family protein